MSSEETTKTIQARLDILKKSLVSEENSVQYYETLISKTPKDKDENIGACRMYEDLHAEEIKHVKTIQDLLIHWEKQLESIKTNLS